MRDPVKNQQLMIANWITSLDLRKPSGFDVDLSKKPKEIGFFGLQNSCRFLETHYGLSIPGKNFDFHNSDLYGPYRGLKFNIRFGLFREKPAWFFPDKSIFKLVPMGRIAKTRGTKIWQQIASTDETQQRFQNLIHRHGFKIDPIGFCEMNRPDHGTTTDTINLFINHDQTFGYADCDFEIYFVVRSFEMLIEDMIFHGKNAKPIIYCEDR